MLELIKSLLDKGLIISSKNGANIQKWDTSYIYQASNKGCFDDEDYKEIIQRFLDENEVEL